MRGLSGYWGAIYQFLISGPRSSPFPGCLVDSIEVSTKSVLSIEIITIVKRTKNCRQSEFENDENAKHPPTYHKFVFMKGKE
jgi:hypothetical protein